MDVATNWQMLVGLVIAYYGTLVFYRLFLHPLARFPGPRLAAISRWYEGYYDVVQGGQYTSKIKELHKIYGPIIRISPYELHVSDSTFFRTIYRLDGRWHKYSWAFDAFGAKNSTVFGSDHDTHKARRGAIAPFFSRSNVADRLNLVHRNIEKLRQRISKLDGIVFNLGAAISAFARDNTNEFLIRKMCNDLDLEDFNIAVATNNQGAGVFWRTTKHIRWFGPALRGMPIEWVKKIANEDTKTFFGFLQRSEQDTRDTMADAMSSSPDQRKHTMVHMIYHSDLPPADKTFNRVFEELVTASGAGFESISNTLRLIFYHIYSNDSIMRRLREEIGTVSTGSSEPIALKKLEQLPYLTAVITEGLRLSPAVASRAARVTDKDLFYKNWRIPAGTPVGMTTLLMHTDAELYPDPMRFNPDRWMDPTARRAAASTFAPFSRGTRICLGMHLAWVEMYLLVASLVQNFTFIIKGATASDFELLRDNFAIGTKATCNLMVQVTLHED